MPPAPRYLVLRGEGDDARRVGALFDLPHQGSVCLHVDDPEVVRVLEEGGLLLPSRPPFLDAGGSGVHGAYRPRTQVNVFLAPPLDAIVDEIAPTLGEAGYRLAEAGTAA